MNALIETKTIHSSTSESYTDDGEYSTKEISNKNQTKTTDVNCNYIESSSISHHFEKLQINTLQSKAARKSTRKKNQLVSLIEKLSIRSESSKQTDGKKLVGEITSILNTLGLVLIQLQSSSIILDINTPLFLCNPDSQDPENFNYIFLGLIDDVFGQIVEPRYSVYYSRESTSFLQIGASVYYDPNDPKSHLHYVENIIYHRLDVLPENKLCKSLTSSKRRRKKRCSMQPYHRK